MNKGNNSEQNPRKEAGAGDSQSAIRNPQSAIEWRPRANVWLITLAVMLATFMEVLDTTIVNVSVPYIAGSLAASNSEATWVLTSYLVSNAIILPASAWLGRFFGRKRFLIACVIIFTVSSFLCGAATSLGFLIITRIIQGAGGGALQPFSQAIMLESFPPQKRGIAMGIFGIGVVVAPVVGPALGGWITDNYSWRWIFYINIPIGILAVFLLQAFVEDPPYIKQAKSGRIDIIGFGLLALWIATLQIVLDKGQEDDWFSAIWIRWFVLISAIAFIAFVIHQLRTKEPIVNLRVFKNRNFAVGSLLILIVGVALYGSIVMLPLFLQTLMGYPALQSGLTVSPRGLGALVAMPLVGILVNKVDNRFLIASGFLTFTAASIMLSHVTLDVSRSFILWPNIMMGAAFGLIFVPLTTMTLGKLSNDQIGNGTGIFNLMRNLGGSIGISLVTTLLDRSAQIHQSLMRSHLTPFDPALRRQIESLTQVLGSEQRAYYVIYNTLLRQASLWAYVNNFRLFAAICAICAFSVILFKKVRATGGAVAVH
ncbi:MAG: DHA2 family efflux MFS transporter permease subunit [Blastocatellia bacterium]|nr:DHA2 family efflux MFS transporter permease subunit [Blastocatellia bacterium]